jgi:hypothetical protein
LLIRPLKPIGLIVFVTIRIHTRAVKDIILARLFILLK